VFNGGIELSSVDQDEAIKYPCATDVSAIQLSTSLRMFFGLLEENGIDGGKPLCQNTYPCVSNTPTGASGQYRSVFVFDNLIGTLAMSPYNKAFRFNLLTMKVNEDGVESVDHITADYRNVTAKTLWEESLTQIQKNTLIAGKVASYIRILQNKNQEEENAKLYFNARLIKI